MHIYVAFTYFYECPMLWRTIIDKQIWKWLCYNKTNLSGNLIILNFWGKQILGTFKLKQEFQKTLSQKKLRFIYFYIEMLCIWYFHKFRWLIWIGMCINKNVSKKWD